MKKNFLIINGPNINLTGFREPEVYGYRSYLDLVNIIKGYCKAKNCKVKVVQTNHEGRIIDFMQYALLKRYNGIILNAGAFTHYSYAIRDAITSIDIPVIEVHMSNIQEREDFRKISVISEVCMKTFQGKKFQSYLDAIEFLLKLEDKE